MWQKSYKLALLTYCVTCEFPKEEAYGMISQMESCSISILSNFAERYARQKRKEYLRFLRMAFVSGSELKIQLLLSKDLEYLTNKNYTKLNPLLQEVMKMLNVLIKKLNTSA